MTLAVLQSCYARAVTGSHGRAGGEGLSEREGRWLADVTDDPGLDVLTSLYRSWRLTKVISLLPMTADGMATDELAGLLTQFWSSRAAVGPYFVEECLAFVDFLEEHNAIQSLAVADLVAFERARLELRDEIDAGSPTAERTVTLRHRPRELFDRSRRADAVVSAELSTLRGRLDAGGEERWAVVAGPDAGVELNVASAAR